MMNQLKLGRNPLSLMRFLCRMDCIKFDYHNVSAARLCQWIQNVPPAPDDEIDVIVLIGHTKEHIDDGEFESLLEMLSRDERLKLVSFSEVAKMLRENRRDQRSVEKPLIFADSR